MAISEFAVRHTRPAARLIALLGTAVLLFAAIGLAGSRSEACDSVCMAKQLLLALYPDLAGKRARFKVTGEGFLDAKGSMAVFEVSIPTPVRDSASLGQNGAPESTDRLHALFTISSGPTRVLDMGCDGDGVNGATHRKLTDLVDSHSEWTDEQALQALKDAGAGFGPDAKHLIEANLPFVRLEPILGKIRLTTLHFQVRTDSVPPLATMDWQADFTAKKAGKEARYYLTIEPFGGRPIGLHQLPSAGGHQ